jgi:hypothetical protein
MADISPSVARFKALRASMRGNFSFKLCNRFSALTLSVAILNFASSIRLSLADATSIFFFVFRVFS